MTMTKLPDGPYHFYINETAKPIVVEAYKNHISEVGESDWRPLSQYAGGRFIPLVEQPQPQGAQGAGGVDGQHGALTD